MEQEIVYSEQNVNDHDLGLQSEDSLNGMFHGSGHMNFLYSFRTKENHKVFPECSGGDSSRGFQ